MRAPALVACAIVLVCFHASHMQYVLASDVDGTLVWQGFDFHWLRKVHSIGAAFGVFATYP